MPNEANTGTRAYVPGKQVTVAHLIAHPATEICEKAGIPDVDAIGILTLTPGETAIIAGDMAVRSADVNVAFLDRFSGTLILYGSVGAVEQALEAADEELLVDDHHDARQQQLNQTHGNVVAVEPVGERPAPHHVAHREVHQHRQKDQ
jgi:ethanolamine utilization protein EutS